MRVTQHVLRAHPLTVEDARRIMAIPEAELRTLLGSKAAHDNRTEAARVLGKR